jgi:oligopeptide/dipeptide ABC transporter ATP-binding protein
MLLLLDEPTAGTILFRGVEVSSQDTRRLSDFRSAVQAVFQDPWGSLNPRMKIRESIVEPAEISRGMPRSETSTLCAELLAAVGLPASAADQYPHEFSGGQRQRIVIARALSPNPSLIVLDEPVSSLDVSIRAQVLNLLRDLQLQRGLSFLLIAHDLATVRYLCNRVAVMYLGRIVEEGPVDRVLRHPAHPYTRALVAASTASVKTATARIKGDVASAIDPPSGCHFHPRCPSAFAPCDSVYPDTDEAGPAHYVRCHLYSSAPAQASSARIQSDIAAHDR